MLGMVPTCAMSGLRLSESIVYTEQGENHGHMILHGSSYSAYTVLQGHIITYGKALL